MSSSFRVTVRIEPPQLAGNLLVGEAGELSLGNEPECGLRQGLDPSAIFLGHHRYELRTRLRADQHIEEVTAPVPVRAIRSASRRTAPPPRFCRHSWRWRSTALQAVKWTRSRHRSSRSSSLGKPSLANPLVERVEGTQRDVLLIIYRRRAPQCAKFCPSPLDESSEVAVPQPLDLAGRFPAFRSPIQCVTEPVASSPAGSGPSRGGEGSSGGDLDASMVDSASRYLVTGHSQSQGYRITLEH